MIKAQDLRIGNLFIDDQNEIRKVSIISPRYVKWFDISTGQHIDVLYHKTKPIPLTEEWLLKFGFEVDWIISHKETYFNLFQKGEEFFYSSDMHHHSSVGIKYVNQLQNLYYAITGEELTTN